MQEIIMSVEERTLISKYKPIFKDCDIDNLELHQLQLEDADKGVGMLAASLEEFGQGRAVYCVKSEGDKLLIIEGSRIWKAAEHLGWNAISVVILTEIEEDDIVALMMALKSHQGKINYGRLAKNFMAVKNSAQKFLKDAKVEGNEESDMTTRKYLQKVFGFENEKYVSDFEHILKSPDRDYILAQLDSGFWKFSKAVKKAKGKADPPKPDPKSKKESPNVYMCDDCPRRKAFKDKLNDTCASSIEELNQTEKS